MVASLLTVHVEAAETFLPCLCLYMYAAASVLAWRSSAVVAAAF